ncbi:AI-2E family transporter [Eubacterium ramulus]
MKFQNFIEKNKYLLLIIAILLILLLGKTNTEWNLLHTIWEILLPFLIGCILAFILNIPMRFIEKRLLRQKSNRYRTSIRIISFLLTLLIVVAVIWLILFFMIPQLTQSFSMLSENITDFVPQFQSSIEHLNENAPLIGHLTGTQAFDTQQLLQAISDFLKDSAKTITGSTISAIGSVFQGIVTGFLAFAFACYLLFQKEKLQMQVKKVIYAFCSEERAEKLFGICAMISRSFTRFFTGQCLEALILGGLFLLTLTIFRMPYALLISVVIACTALIPIFGAFIGCIFGVFLIFIVNPQQAVVFLIIFFVLQQIEGNLIYPHVVGNSVGLPSIWVLLAVIAGGKLMGIVGMFLFIPLASVCYTLFRQLVYDRLKEKIGKQSEEQNRPGQ